MGVRLELFLLIYNCGKYTTLLACRQKAKEKKCPCFLQKTAKKRVRPIWILPVYLPFDTKEAF